jgi:hypothetical protein
MDCFNASLLKFMPRVEGKEACWNGNQWSSLFRHYLSRNEVFQVLSESLKCFRLNHEELDLVQIIQHGIKCNVSAP